MDKRTISLPDEHALYIDSKVDSGAYASASEVVRAGLRALQERDKAVEEWLRDKVASTHDAMIADPARGIPSKDVFDEIRNIHSDDTKNKT